MNIIQIVSDTFRYHHLGFNGNKRFGHDILTGSQRNARSSTTITRNSHPTMPARADLFTGKLTYTFRAGSHCLPTRLPLHRCCPAMDISPRP